LSRALRVALVVGTCLTVLNQGDVIIGALLHGAPLSGVLLWKVPLTYAVPFLVSWYSSAATLRS
jgi:hypothetical protein